MEFVIWFGLVVVAAAFAGEHAFPVIVLGAAAQFLFALGLIFAGRRRYARHHD